MLNQITDDDLELIGRKQCTPTIHGIDGYFPLLFISPLDQGLLQDMTGAANTPDESSPLTFRHGFHQLCFLRIRAFVYTGFAFLVIGVTSQLGLQMSGREGLARAVLLIMAPLRGSGGRAWRASRARAVVLSGEELGEELRSCVVAVGGAVMFKWVGGGVAGEWKTGCLG